MSQINYANATFNKVVLEGTDFKDKEAVTASYVTAKIDHLVNVGNVKADVTEPQLAFEIHVSSCWMAAICRWLPYMYYSGTRRV